MSTMLDDTIPTATNSDTPSPQSEDASENKPTTDTPIIQDVPNEPPPPAGDNEKSEKYLKQLIELINQDKLPVSHTDLNKFNIASIEDHYRMDLGEYEVEINHSKQPDTGQDFYIMLFNNIKKIEGQEQNCINKIILAYTHLTQPQFEDFKEAADAAIERKRKKEEEKRFQEAMNPIDDLLSNLSTNSVPAENESTNDKVASDEEPEELASADDSVEEIDDDSKDDSPKASDFLSQPPASI